MDVHEFQAKMILERAGVPISPYRIVESVEEAKEAIEALGLNDAVVKVQVHAGGRGKAGGVKVGRGHQAILGHVDAMLGMKIVNNQTGPLGVIAKKVMITECIEIKKEYYVAAIIDRHNAQASVIVSPEGGVEIEEVAERSPSSIRTFPLTLSGLLRNYQKVQIAKFMGWKGELAKKGVAVVAAVAKAFTESDASLLEINPLVETADGEIIALDAKMNIDDNALFRQQKIASFYDEGQVPPHEARAKRSELAYIALEGNIGCMVNGAGLAMATMDIIQYYGGRPANFLDVGGSASEEKVAEGFKIILSDPDVKAILINIFGGIMNCEVLARGVVAAAKEQHVKVPLVVRMEGTNVEKGKEILAEAKLNIITASSLTEAAQKVVASIS